jgi:hypothetical protein
VITYRELRLLELEVLRHLHKNNQVAIDLQAVALLDVDMMNGIEIEEFPARIAEVAMWLIDHQMNMLMSMEFGQYYARLPLNKSANIVHADSLEYDWQDVVPKESLSFILGNPPFIGSKLMTQHQRDQIKRLFNNNDGSGILDYVSGWYIKSAELIQSTKIKVAFVSTNSITQGEQVGALWKTLLDIYHMHINFSHRTFKWSNEAKGNAAVYCVIIGFANFNTPNKSIFEYEEVTKEGNEVKVKNINPYLVDAKDVIVIKRTNPICTVPKMSFGNMPLDGGHLLLTDKEKSEFILIEPKANRFIYPLISAYEFLNGEKRWCLWLLDAQPNDLKQMPEVMKKVELVKKFRLDSVATSTQKFALTPTLFRDRKQPSTYILIPSTTSENRIYIPMGFFSKNDIANNSCHTIPNGNLYHYGILTSTMHMAWVRTVCGRLESRYRYSKDIVYNNYPWPENPSESHIQKIEQAAQKVLDARALFPESSLAVLYDPLTMPPELVKAHQELDKAVDLAYRPQPFPSEAKRMEFLFELYEKYTANLFTKEKVKKSAKKGIGKAKE